MKKSILVLAVLALALTGARANILINGTNFPDENFRQQVKDAFDSDGDGTISDEELEANGGHHNFDRVSNLTGIELLTSITELYIVNYPDEPCLTTFDYALPNLHWLDIQDQVGVLTTVDATKCTNLEYFLAGENPANLSTLKLPSCLKNLSLNNAPLIKTFDPKQFSDLRSVAFTGTTGITDLDFSGHMSIQNIGVDGIHDYYQLNSLNMANCPLLTNIDIKSSTIKSLTFKSLPSVQDILVDDSDITSMLVDDLAQLSSIEALNNVLGTLTLNNLPAIYGLDCKDNKLHTLIIDNCPNMNGIWAEHNKLMWLDLQDVEKSETDYNTLKIDDQQPSATAWKLSPTQVGLRAHERMNPARMLNLKTNGKSVTATETTIDGIRYIVFYDNGANADNLVGNTSTYDYETKWPYEWMEGNTKDNNLPVNLTISNVDKPASFIKLSSTATLKTEVGGTLVAPTVMPSDGYIETGGKLTWKSSDESVVKVDAEGKLTVVGPGTATITVSGTATDYRYAPESVSYSVAIYALGDVNWDGKIDIVDVTSVISHILGQTPDGFHAAAADVNGDGKVDIVDVTSIIDLILK